MAVGRVELDIPELQGLMDRLKDVKRGHDMWRCKREIKRGLDRALASQADDQARMRRMRANRRKVTMDAQPLVPQSMSRPHGRMKLDVAGAKKQLRGDEPKEG